MVALDTKTQMLNSVINNLSKTLATNIHSRVRSPSDSFSVWISWKSSKMATMRCMLVQNLESDCWRRLGGMCVFISSGPFDVLEWILPDPGSSCLLLVDDRIFTNEWRSAQLKASFLVLFDAMSSLWKNRQFIYKYTIWASGSRFKQFNRKQNSRKLFSQKICMKKLTKCEMILY